MKVRLESIDAPEFAQPFGSASRRSLTELIKGKRVALRCSKIDHYRRRICLVFAGAVDINREQLRRGLA